MVVYDENIREALACLADVEWQRRVWAAYGRDPREMDSFEECVERLYTDSLLSDTLGRGHLVYSSEVDRALC